MNQTQMITFNELLESDCAALETRLREAGKDVPARPQFRKDDHVEKADVLEGHRAGLQNLCEFGGIKIGPVAKQTATKPLTATEKCLGANGESETAKRQITYTGASARAKEACHRGMPPEK